MTPRRLALAGLTLVLSFGAWSVRSATVAGPAANLPARLSDRQFWTLVEQFSEPNGYFRSDNLVSNEDTFQFVIPELTGIVKPGGVYLGVGPDQNFTYIAALEPGMAFITDIRRGNLQEHLMYKALLELAPTRTEFLSRLFSRKAPDGLGPDATVADLFEAYNRVRGSQDLYDTNFAAIKDLLITRHKFPLDDEDVAGIGYVYGSFFAAGPYLSYSTSGFGSRGRYPSYRDLQVATDASGVPRGYLASEGNYQTLRALEQKNLILPVVGNFAGPKALRAIGAWLRDRGATVTVFYLSNVEQYLFQDRIWAEFARNVETLPLDGTSTFIRSCFNNCASSYPSRSVSLLDSMTALLKDVRAGRVNTYWDVLAHSRNPAGVQ
jgi:hypothetical protein